MPGVDQPGVERLQRFEPLGRRLGPLLMGLLVLVVRWLAGSSPRAATLGALTAAAGWAFETTRKVAGWPVALAVVLLYALTALVVGWTLRWAVADRVRRGNGRGNAGAATPAGDGRAGRAQPAAGEP